MQWNEHGTSWEGTLWLYDPKWVLSPFLHAPAHPLAKVTLLQCLLPSTVLSKELPMAQGLFPRTRLLQQRTFLFQSSPFYAVIKTLFGLVFGFIL